MQTNREPFIMIVIYILFIALLNYIVVRPYSPTVVNSAIIFSGCLFFIWSIAFQANWLGGNIQFEKFRVKFFSISLLLLLPALLSFNASQNVQFILFGFNYIFILNLCFKLISKYELNSKYLSYTLTSVLYFSLALILSFFLQVGEFPFLTRSLLISINIVFVSLFFLALIYTLSQGPFIIENVFQFSKIQNNQVPSLNRGNNTIEVLFNNIEVVEVRVRNICIEIRNSVYLLITSFLNVGIWFCKSVVNKLFFVKTTFIIVLSYISIQLIAYYFFKYLHLHSDLIVPYLEQGLNTSNYLTFIGLSFTLSVGIKFFLIVIFAKIKNTEKSFSISFFLNAIYSSVYTLVAFGVFAIIFVCFVPLFYLKSIYTNAIWIFSTISYAILLFAISMSIFNMKNRKRFFSESVKEPYFELINFNAKDIYSSRPLFLFLISAGLIWVTNIISKGDFWTKTNNIILEKIMPQNETKKVDTIKNKEIFETMSTDSLSGRNDDSLQDSESKGKISTIGSKKDVNEKDTRINNLKTIKSFNDSNWNGLISPYEPKKSNESQRKNKTHNLFWLGEQQNKPKYSPGEYIDIGIPKPKKTKHSVWDDVGIDVPEPKKTEHSTWEDVDINVPKPKAYAKVIFLSYKIERVFVDGKSIGWTTLYPEDTWIDCNTKGENILTTNVEVGLAHYYSFGEGERNVIFVKTNDCLRISNSHIIKY